MTVPGESTSDAPFWHLAPEEAFDHLGSGPGGLSSAEARIRRSRFGPNTIRGGRRTDALSLLARQFASPIILILVFATIVSGLLGDVTDAAIILAIITFSSLLGFWQERGATRAGAASDQNGAATGPGGR
jgi:Mg2+-importing ATPase